MSTQTPETLLREYAEHYNLMPEDVDFMLSLLRQAERAAALAMRGRCVALVEARADCFLRESGQDALLDAIEALEV